MNNKGITVIELIAMMMISSIILLTLTQLVIFLTNVNTSTLRNNSLANEGQTLVTIAYENYNDIVPRYTESCSGNANCIVFAQDDDNKIQIGFITDPDDGELIEIVRTIDGSSTTSYPLFRGTLSNNTVFQSCLSCPNPINEVYVMEFDLTSDGETRTFRTSFRTQ